MVGEDVLQEGPEVWQLGEDGFKVWPITTFSQGSRSETAPGFGSFSLEIYLTLRMYWLPQHWPGLPRRWGRWRFRVTSRRPAFLGLWTLDPLFVVW